MTLEDSLSAAFGSQGRLVFEMSPLGGIVARMSAGGGMALVALQGAQVLSWLPARGAAEVLWLSPVAKLGTGKAVRGGIPVCWPWFGPHSNPASGLGAHGFVRAADWHVIESAITDRQTRLSLGYTLTEKDLAALGGQARVVLTVTLSDCLEIAITTENIGATPITISEALHSYFSIGDIASVDVTGLDGRGYTDQLSGAVFEQQSSIVIPSETDRIYWDTPDTTVIRDTLSRRDISISKTGSASTVVWNPWRDKAARLGDMPDDSFRNMLCIETANVGPHNVVTIAAGQSHTLSARIAVI